MDVKDLIKQGKTKIRNSEVLSSLFSDYYSELVGGVASFCCTFSDFDKLRDKVFINNITMELKKYSVNYKPNEQLYYVENKRVYRRYAKRVDDDFLDKFLKLHDKNKFPDAKDKIVKIEVEKPAQEEKPKTTRKKRTPKNK